MLRVIKTDNFDGKSRMIRIIWRKIHLRPSASIQKTTKILFYFYESGTTWLQASQEQCTKLSYSPICMLLLKLHSSVGYILHLVPPAE